MSRTQDINQTSLDLWVQLEVQREKRRKFHNDKKTKFYYNQLSLENLLKMTYDITDKDFEYFIKNLLEKEWYKAEVTWGYPDEWVDVKAFQNGVWHFIQCKQWWSDMISEREIWEYYWGIFHLMKEFPRVKFQYITTSYLSTRAIEFCDEHNITWMDNKWLMELCIKHRIFDGDNWTEIRKNIYRNRLEDMRKRWIQNVKDELKKRGIEEYRSHISYKLRNKVIFNSNSRNTVTEFLEIVESL